MTYTFIIDNQRYSVQVGAIVGNQAQVLVNGQPISVTIENQPAVQMAPAPVAAPIPVATPAPTPAAAPAAASMANAPVPQGAGVITAPIPGLIVDIRVKAGDTVLAGETVAVMEAMKMENSLTTPVDGTVTEVRAQKGGEVATGDVIMIIDQAAGAV